MKKNIKHVSGMIGSPSFYGRETHQKHDDEQITALKACGIDTLFLNIAWSRPWLDVVNLEDIAISHSYPAFSSENVVDSRREFIRRLDAVKKQDLKAMGLFGIPKYLDFAQCPEDYKALLGSTQGTISSEDHNICISHPGTLKLYTELVKDLLADAPELDGMLVYTFDELAEVCAEDSDCPRCKGIPLAVRIPAFLNALYDNLQNIKPGFELWWEPWEISESQVYAACDKLNSAITLSVHSTINEVYFVNSPDRVVRNLVEFCKQQDRKLIVELFLSGSGEDLGPIASYPCPRLVLDQLSSIDYFEGNIGIKEYYGLCVEYFSVNEAAFKDYITGSLTNTAQIVDKLADDYAENEENSRSLRKMWDYSSHALMFIPWDISWVMRFSNYLPYDEHWGKINFKSAMCTPWTTPSWLSSRRSFYHIVENSKSYNKTLYEDVRARLKLAIAAANEALAIGNGIQVKIRYKAEFKRQLEALELFIICASSRVNWQELSYQVELIRGGESKDSSSLIEELLLAEAENAARLIDYIKNAEVKCFLLPSLDTLDSTLSSIHKLIEFPQNIADCWITTL